MSCHADRSSRLPAHWRPLAVARRPLLNGAGKTPPNLRFLQPATISKQLGYTHVVEATMPGRIVYVAGQMGLDGNGNLVGAPGDFRAQATQAWENVRAALAAADGGLEHIVKVTQFLLHLRAHRPWCAKSVPSLPIPIYLHRQALWCKSAR
jgi:enamine deaminase RidA (YjgF/YER057c/UK114 family)